MSKKIDTDTDTDNYDEEKEIIESHKTGIEDLLFKLPKVPAPLMGSPKEVQKDLDKMAIHIRRNPDNKRLNELYFDTIHLYMHGFLVNVALKQFPFIKGYQTIDIYQEALIALRFKAIPGFRRGKGMSFLNFSKMCIRRHLITILNQSKTRLKDQSMNQAISLDSSPSYFDNDDGNMFSNIIPDTIASADRLTEEQEAYDVTLKNLCIHLSEFEKKVLFEYLTSSSYTEIAEDLSPNKKSKKPTKSVDNALVRIRHKAQKLKENGKIEEIPLFIL